jgi:ferritin
MATQDWLFIFAKQERSAIEKWRCTILFEEESVMLNERMQEALNEQLNWELYSSYLYASMSAYFQSINLKGFANWMHVQALEELTHAGKFFNFINERAGRVLLQPIGGPPTQWESPKEAFVDALGHEQIVTLRINDLVNLAMDERDHASNIFLQWFVTEQVEEEASVDEVLQQLKLAGDRPETLFLIDRELGQRAFTMPAADGE